MNLQRRDVVLTLGLALLLGVGCGPSDGKYVVTGKVTLDGQPIPNGEIRFVDSTNAQNVDGAAIEGGKFNFETSARQNRVEIRASKESPGMTTDSGIDPGQKTPLIVEYIPAKYNERSELSAEVSAGGPNVFEFKLESK